MRARRLRELELAGDAASRGWEREVERHPCVAARIEQLQDLVIGHNIYEFDLPFLYKHSFIHRVRPSVRLSFFREGYHQEIADYCMRDVELMRKLYWTE